MFPFFSGNETPPLRENVFFTILPSDEGLSAGELCLAPAVPRSWRPPDLPAPIEVQRVLAGLDALDEALFAASKLLAVFERVAAFWRVHDPGQLGEPHDHSALQTLRSRSAAAESAALQARSATRLARAVFQEGAEEFLGRFMQVLQFYLDDEPPGSPVFSALLERAAEAARLHVLTDAGLSPEYGGRIVPAIRSEAERYLLEQERSSAAARRLREAPPVGARSGPIHPARASLVEEAADAARDWARSELRHAHRFQQPVVTDLAATERRSAELDGLVRAVSRIVRTAPPLAERLAKSGLGNQLSPDAQRLFAQLTNSEKCHVPSSIGEEQRRCAEAERLRWESVALQQKRLARTSSHPSVLYARDEDERQEAAFRLAWAWSKHQRV